MGTPSLASSGAFSCSLYRIVAEQQLAEIVVLLCGGKQQLLKASRSSRYVTCACIEWGSDTDSDEVGTLDDDDALNAAKPANEFFIPSRVSWLQAIPDAEQKETM